MRHQGRTTRGARVAPAIIILIFASPLSSFAGEPAVEPAAGGRIVTLAQCVAQALASGPDARISRANLGVAQAQYDDAAAANGFGLSGSIGYDRTPFTTRYSDSGVPVQVTQNSFQGGLTFSAPFSTSVSIGATHTITELAALDQSTKFSLSASAAVWDGYPGGQARGAARLAAFTRESAQSTEDAGQKTVVYNVKQAYYTLLGQQGQIAIFEETVAQRLAELQKTQSLFDARRVSQIDLKQAQLNTLQADLDLSRARRLLEIDRELLSNLVGWPTETVYEAADVPDLPEPSLDVGEAVRKALASRADFRQLQFSLQSSEVTLALKMARTKPTVSVNTGISYIQDWTNSSNNTPSWHAGLTIEAPVIDAGSLGAQVREASLQQEKLRVQKGQLSAAIATSVKNAVYVLQDLLSRVELARQSQELAQDQYDLAEVQFEHGVVSHLDLLTASVALTTARVAAAAAHSSAQLGVLALQDAIGE
jgi:outer membrane protein, multidrug efflux system